MSGPPETLRNVERKVCNNKFFGSTLLVSASPRQIEKVLERVRTEIALPYHTFENCEIHRCSTSIVVYFPMSWKPVGRT
jgi:hypothetical protein